jgi:L-histidine N-alpha-methyltransferase
MTIDAFDVTQPVVAKPIASSFAMEVRAGLLREGQKSLPPKYFYDSLGSTLFEAITLLPEYGVWRAERRLLIDNADAMASYANASMVIELGSGSASKTTYLLRALLAKRAVSYCVVEISRAAIEMTRRELASLSGLSVSGVEAEYLSGLEAALRARPANGKVLVMFLGGSIGNADYLSNARFLQRIRRLLQPGDGLLLGADLEKPSETLLAAYDDALGVTAAFNLNYLVRMNRELGADFRLPNFRHRACFDTRKRDVEMHLVSLCTQQVHIPAAGIAVSLEEGETIHTESSHKYSLDELADLTGCSGFECVMQWFDIEWRFASGLYRAA